MPNNPLSNGCATTTSAAERALFLPELLEKILGNVHLCDLFRAAAVCRTWKTIFEDSRYLQMKAQLEENPNGSHYEDKFDDELGLRVSSTALDLAVDGRIYFHLKFVMDKHRPIQLTENLRKCLATQPGCTSMWATPWCCDQDLEWITRETGLTIGDVIDAARRIHAEHEHCPQMVESMWTHSDMSTHYPVFHGRVQLPEEHPEREAAKAKRAMAEAEVSERAREHYDAGSGDIWYAYRKARRTAAANGQDLPRWPEFLSANKELAPRVYQLSKTEARAAAYTRGGGAFLHVGVQR